MKLSLAHRLGAVEAHQRPSVASPAPSKVAPGKTAPKGVRLERALEEFEAALLAAASAHGATVPLPLLHPTLSAPTHQPAPAATTRVPAGPLATRPAATPVAEKEAAEVAGNRRLVREGSTLEDAARSKDQAPGPTVATGASQTVQQDAAAQAENMKSPATAAPLAPVLPELPLQVVGLAAHAAQLHIETPRDGVVDVQLHLRDGVAHVQFTGEGAGRLEAHAMELRTALAASGLQLGGFDLGSSSHGGHLANRDGAPERPPVNAAQQAAPSTLREATRAHGARHHVKA